MFLDNKKIILLKHLNEKIKETSKKLGISERTIRYRINDLNEFFIDENINYKVIIENGIIKGFGNLENVNKEIENKSYNFSKNERLEMISLFLLIYSYGCKADEICNFINISRSTLKIDLRFVRDEFKNKELKIISKANKGLIIEGNEIIKRKFLLEKLKKIFLIEDKKLKFFEKNKYKINLIKKYISNKKIEIVNEYLEKLKIDLNKKISDEAYQIIMIYLIILLNRLQNNLVIEKNIQNQEFMKTTKEFETVKNNINILENGNNILINECEIIKITEFVLGSHTYNFKYSFYENWIYIEKMADDLIKKISEKININILKDNTLREGLINHLIPTIYRLKNDIELENSIHREIIEQYPVLYYEVKQSLKKIEDFVGKEFSENETSFFVVHFILSLKRIEKKQRNEKKKILIVCGLGYGTSNLLKQEMEEFFDIEVKDLVPLNNLKNINLNNIDFIITTTNISKENIHIPIIKVNSILTKENISDLLSMGIRNRKNRVNICEILKIIKIYSKIENEKGLTENLIEYFENLNNVKFEQFVEPSLLDILPLKNIKIIKKVNTWEEAVFETGKILYKNGYIQYEYINKMIDKIKELGMYMIIGDEIILPHADIKENVIKTGISYLQLKNAINFNNTKIKHIFALASYDKKEHIKGLLKLKENIDEKNLKNILEKCNTPEEIFNVIKKL